jgi:hypothetical protein
MLRRSVRRKKRSEWYSQYRSKACRLSRSCLQRQGISLFLEVVSSGSQPEEKWALFPIWHLAIWGTGTSMEAKRGGVLPVVQALPESLGEVVTDSPFGEYGPVSGPLGDALRRYVRSARLSATGKLEPIARRNKRVWVGKKPRLVVEAPSDLTTLRSEVRQSVTKLENLSMEERLARAASTTSQPTMRGLRMVRSGVPDPQITPAVRNEPMSLFVRIRPVREPRLSRPSSASSHDSVAFFEALTGPGGSRTRWEPSEDIPE